MRPPQLHLARCAAATSTPTTPHCSTSTRAVRETEGVNHAFVTSGIRYDLFLHDKRRLAEGEGATNALRRRAGAAPRLRPAQGRARAHERPRAARDAQAVASSSFYKFKEKFDRATKKAGKEKTQIIPYFISSHPGSRRRTWPSSRSRRRTSVSDWSRCRISRPRR